MTDISSRIRIARELKGWNQSELARELGVRPQAVQLWEKGGGIRHSRLTEVAKKLGVTLEYLMFGDDEDVFTAVRETPARHGRSNNGRVPLLDWIRVEDWINGREAGPKDYLQCPTPVSEKAFALRITGLSGQPKYMPEDIAFVDPDVLPANGRDVIVIPAPMEPPVLRTMSVEGGERYLAVINKAWPEVQIAHIEPDTKVAGTIIGKWTEA